MEIDISLIAVGEEQPLPSFSDQYRVLEMGYCQDLLYTCTIRKDNTVQTVPFLRVEDSKIILDSPTSAAYIGVWTATFTVLGDGASLFSTQFGVTVNTAACELLQFSFGSIDPIEFQLGETLEVTSPITVADEDGWLGMGLCGVFEYEVLIGIAAPPWVWHDTSSISQDPEIIVQIPNTPTDIRSYVKVNTGTFKVTQSGQLKHNDAFTLTVLEPDCS